MTLARFCLVSHQIRLRADLLNISDVFCRLLLNFAAQNQENENFFMLLPLLLLFSKHLLSLVLCSFVI